MVNTDAKSGKNEWAIHLVCRNSASFHRLSSLFGATTVVPSRLVELGISSRPALFRGHTFSRLLPPCSSFQVITALTWHFSFLSIMA